MKLLQLPSGTIIDEDELTEAQPKEPVGRPSTTVRHEGDPEIREVRTAGGVQLMWVRQVRVITTYAPVSEIVMEPPELGEAVLVDDTVTMTTKATISRVDRPAESWGRRWWEPAPWVSW